MFRSFQYDLLKDLTFVADLVFPVVKLLGKENISDGCQAQKKPYVFINEVEDAQKGVLVKNQKSLKKFSM